MNKSGIDLEKEEMAAKLKGSLLYFTQFFFKHLQGRDFILSNPAGRESHQITVCRELTNLSRLQIPSQRLLINLPPGFGKSLLVCHWVAWCIAQYPDSNFLYLSYSFDLASKNTYYIKQIINSQMFRYLFDVKVRSDSKAKDNFMTEQGGVIRAFSSYGAVVGSDAGRPGLDRFSGAVILDDPIKADEAHSNTIRENVIRNYQETIAQRPRGINVPIVFIGQRLHEADLAAWLLEGNDIAAWDKIVLKAIDDAGNALYPEVMPLQRLLDMKEKSPYVFSSQYQQEPVPAGGALFKPEWVVELFDEPTMLATFITADTAETSKSYNDATAFSFWGVYEIETQGRKTGHLGLHWIDAVELHVEPKDLKEAFLDFWAECMRYKMPPSIAAIEKKSTGVTLLSTLHDMRTLQIRDIPRHAGSGSKTERFLQAQPYIAGKYVSINQYAKHKRLVLDHISKVTATDSHRRDDLMDTLVDAIRIALIDKSLYTTVQDKPVNNEAMDIINRDMMLRKKLGAIRYG